MWERWEKVVKIQHYKFFYLEITKKNIYDLGNIFGF
jgi:hypothetical protein